MGFLGSWQASRAQAVGYEDLLAITTAAHEGIGRVEEKGMLRTGSLALVSGKRTSWLPAIRSHVIE